MRVLQEGWRHSAGMEPTRAVMMMSDDALNGGGVACADSNSDGFLDYEEFLNHFRRMPTIEAVEDGDLKEYSNVEICKLLLQSFGTMSDSFEHLDADKDGRLSREEISEGLRSIGVSFSCDARFVSDDRRCCLAWHFGMALPRRCERCAVPAVNESRERLRRDACRVGAARRSG